MTKKILSFLYRCLRRMALVIGTLVLVSMVASCSIGLYVAGLTPAPTLKDPSILVVRLGPGFDQDQSYQWLDHPLAPPPPNFTETTVLVNRAIDDPRIKGVVFSLRGAALDAAQVQEFRRLIARARTAKKITAIYAPSYDHLTDYYLAAAFEHIWLQPVGVVGLNGVGGTQPFLKGLLDLVGVRADFIQRHEYKSAMEGFTRTDMSPAARTMTKELIGDLADQIVNDIARDRQLEVTQVRALLDQGLITAPEAHKAKLVDRLDHADALTGFLREQVGAKADDDEAVMFVRPGNYRALTTPSPTLSERLGLGTDDENAKPVVATITIKGPIYAEHEGGSPLMGDLGNQTSDDHVSAIRAAADDDAVKAIVVRIDSPGGTPTAAEDIRRALMVARTEKKKLVVVSMGGLAASGGYWVATAGQTIFAERATLTGSIGVVGGKFDISGLSQKLGVTWDGEAVGENVAMFSPHRGFSPSERARIEAMMDQTYAYFTDLVADARNLKPDAVDALARGRVWTGARATAGGLVDQVGGYQDALAYVAKELKVASIDDLVVEPYPAELSPLERILELLHGQAMMGRMASTIHNVLAHRPYSGIYALSDVSVGP